MGKVIHRRRHDSHLARGARIFTLVSIAQIVCVCAGATSTIQDKSAESYLQRGDALSQTHHYDEAISQYDAAIGLNPDYAEAFNDRGFAYYLKGDYERAIRDFTRAVELRPIYPRAYNNRGVVYMSGGYGAEKSVPDFDRAIEQKPDFRYAYINRANARLLSHPLLALQDFHHAGMHPERTAAAAGGILLLFLATISFLVFKRLRRRTERVIS